jgi:DUF4097 and DUF4098 domain-containing protein YvlB
MRLIALARPATLAAAMLVAVAPAAFSQDQTENVDRTIAFPSNGTLMLKTFSGDVHITGTSGRDLVIKAVRKGTRDQLDHIKLDISTSGSVVSIDANKRDASWEHQKDNVVETTFDIQLPAAATLDVTGFSSPLTIAGVTGSEKLGTFSGTITVTGAKGSVDAKTFSAKIDVDASAAGASPMLHTETFSGDIHAKLADSAKGDVAFDSFSGDYDSDLPLTMRSMHSRGSRNPRNSSSRTTSSETASSGGTANLYFHTFSGDVKITR